VHLLRGLGGYYNLGSVVAPSSTAISGVVPSTGTASGIAVPSTCAPVNTIHLISVPGGYDYYTGQTPPSWSTYLLLQWPPMT
jgi:hypothetical protein